MAEIILRNWVTEGDRFIAQYGKDNDNLRNRIANYYITEVGGDFILGNFFHMDSNGNLNNEGDQEDFDKAHSWEEAEEKLYKKAKRDMIEKAVAEGCDFVDMVSLERIAKNASQTV